MVPITSARRRRWTAVVGVAAASVALLVGVLVVSPWDSDGGPTDQVAAVLEADDAVEIPMTGDLPGLTIVHSAGADAAVLTADAVPLPEGDNVYELWAIRDGTPERFATFRPDADGDADGLRRRPRPGQRRGVGDHRGAGRRQRHADPADPRRHRLIARVPRRVRGHPWP